MTRAGYFEGPPAVVSAPVAAEPAAAPVGAAESGPRQVPEALTG